MSSYFDIKSTNGDPDIEEKYNGITMELEIQRGITIEGSGLYYIATTNNSNTT